MLTEDSSKFEESFPAVNNYIGELGFGFNSAGETVRLFNTSGEIMDSLTYSSSPPWPPQANGFGPSLSLHDASSDNSLPASWGYSLAYGTPGSENEPYTYVYITGITPGLANNSAGIQLDQNYPNPFTENTNISYYLPRAVELTISVFDINGREVDVLVSGEHVAGSHRLQYNAGHLPHGIYYYRLQTVNAVLAKRMIKL